ncbi:MAG: hypothetical protein OEO83_17375 [Alphaproteobacteria bacterium]|nr:hypothetical protein [Alphaproteobacteria bacterium]
MFRFLAPIAMAAGLLACSADVVQLQTQRNRSAYDFLNFTTYHEGRDTKVVVYGNPFAMDRSAFARAVTDTMQGANYGRPTNFTTTPGPSAERNLWVVMAFNADVGPYVLCGGGPVETRMRPDALTLSAAWCFDGRQDSLVTAVVGPATGVNDPRFKALVRQTVLNLFLPEGRRDRDRDRDRDRRKD